MSKDIIKTPHYYTRCPRCGCHFAFELEDFVESGSYSKRDYVDCPYCSYTIQARDINTHILLPNIKVNYTGGKVNKKEVLK
jgi:DNA-directed RNA polymerase subunit RPC12/RpoP